ncbi:MAG: putative quinol monooxygenase [Desulfobacterales bacterium]|nr:putative quinol monooxygenase [Desulfobacterales bacterium]MDD4072440.1 putative quinol monooxygenase [Desulfobacterales bacterium]MDD4392730.1 putative quinol monooxygenase [Desulfobacterales bacterium]
MIVIAAKFKVKPGKKHAFMNLAQVVIACSRQEKRCISYNLYVGAEDSDTFLFFEEWESQDAIEMHFKEPHFVEFSLKNKDMIDGKMDVNIYEAERK